MNRLRTFLLSAFIMLSLATYAQQLHFLYIQADNKQPFSVKLNGKFYSSSSQGYIILPKLTNGTYTLEVNFANSNFSKQTFTVNVAGKNYGYALKNFDARGWGLFNFQSMDVLMNNTAAAASSASSSSLKNTSAFGSMLADVVNDPSINLLSADDTATPARNTIAAATSSTPPPAAAATEPTAASTPEPEVQETMAAALPENTDDAPQNNKERPSIAAAMPDLQETGDTSSDSAGYTTSGVIKADENITDNGTDLTFIEFNGFKNDTIKAFIPAAATAHLPAAAPVDVQAKAEAADSVKGKVSNPFFGDSKPAVTNAVINKPEKLEENATVTNVPATRTMVNTTCNDMMSDADLAKLKKKIITQTNQEDILQTVKKTLRNKCLTTSQVMELGNLFLNDDARYGFYDAAYPFVYDYGTYQSLEKTLLDPYYKTRFKALLR